MSNYKSIGTVGELKKVIASMQDNTSIFIKDLDTKSPFFSSVENIEVGFGIQGFRGISMDTSSGNSSKVENRDYFCLFIRPMRLSEK